MQVYPWLMPSDHYVSGKGKMVEKIKGALSLYDYVPPQFRDS